MLSYIVIKEDPEWIHGNKKFNWDLPIFALGKWNLRHLGCELATTIRETN